MSQANQRHDLVNDLQRARSSGLFAVNTTNVNCEHCTVADIADFDGSVV
jgi:hypothetical protein